MKGVEKMKRQKEVFTFKVPVQVYAETKKQKDEDWELLRHYFNHNYRAANDTVNTLLLFDALKQSLFGRVSLNISDLLESEVLQEGLDPKFTVEMWQHRDKKRRLDKIRKITNSEIKNLEKAKKEGKEYQPKTQAEIEAEVTDSVFLKKFSNLSSQEMEGYLSLIEWIKSTIYANLDDLRRFSTDEKQVKSVAERWIKEQYQLPNSVANVLTRQVAGGYESDKSKTATGKAAVRTYRKTLPVPIIKTCLSIEPDESGEEFFIHWSGQKVANGQEFQFKNGNVLAGNARRIITFKSVLYKERMKKKTGNEKSITNRLKRICSGEYVIGNCMLQLKDKKLMLIVPYTQEVEYDAALDYDRFIGVNLGVRNPLYFYIDGLDEHGVVGSRNQIMRNHILFQKRRRQLQKDAKFVRGGHGRKRKMKKVYALKDAEARKVKHAIRVFISFFVEVARKNQCGNIVVEFLGGFGKDTFLESEERKRFVLRYWNYFQIQQTLKDKLRQYGIRLHYINPEYTSLCCSECGYIDKRNRQPEGSETFTCLRCGFECHADYNASKNISKMRDFLTEKEMKLLQKRRLRGIKSIQNQHPGARDCATGGRY